MNFPPKTTSFKNQEELFKFLCSFPFERDEQVAIIAGHFMLMYDGDNDALVPMIYQDAENDKVRQFSLNLVGDFPVLTFRMGLLLYKLLLSRRLRPKICLAINDHKFQGQGFQSQFEHKLKELGKAAGLRREFYRSFRIRKSFKKILTDEGLAEEDVILSNNNPTQGKGRLGKGSPFFSEKAMRNTFDRRRLNEIKSDIRFRYERRPTKQNPSSYALFYKNGISQNEMCLTEEGSCGCAAEVHEFYIELIRLGFTKIIFFLPQECLTQVGIGTFITAVRIAPQIKVFVITGLGGMGAAYKKTSPIELSILPEQ
ncbi:MAG TPA: hypothetical protein VG347_21485 [Verrucomicrobiae bacterium]|nr:hypothetical protein [Verrucomicrobiae bacterium]